MIEYRGVSWSIGGDESIDTVFTIPSKYNQHVDTYRLTSYLTATQYSVSNNFFPMLVYVERQSFEKIFCIVLEVFVILCDERPLCVLL